MCSSAENFLLIGANYSEDCEPVRRYVTLLERQMTEIEGKLFSVEIEGMEKFVSFNLNCYQMTWNTNENTMERREAKHVTLAKFTTAIEAIK